MVTEREDIRLLICLGLIWPEASGSHPFYLCRLGYMNWQRIGINFQEKISFVL